MEFMGTKREIRKIAELGMIAITLGTLILAGCGGGGGGGTGSSVVTPSSGSPIITTSSLGQFSAGATVRVKDYQGNILDTHKIGTDGTVNIYPNAASSVYPLLVEVGINGDTYYDEKSGGLATVAGVNTNRGAIRAVVPFYAANQAIGVTALTEIAAYGLVDPATGNFKAGITPASAVGANAAVGQLFGVANPLIPPTLVSTPAQVSALTSSTPADSYAVILAGLANTAPLGSNAQSVANSLSSSLNGTSSTAAINQTISSLKTTLSTLASNNPSTALSSATTAIITALPPAPAAGTTLGTLAASVSTAAQAAITQLAINSPAVTNASVITIAQNAASAAAAGTPLSPANITAAITAAPNIANATTLLNGLHTNFILQASGVQADLNNITSPFQEIQNFSLFLYQGVNLASSGSLPKTATVNGYPCQLMSVTGGTGTVVCQWANNNGNAASTLHQLTITGPNVPANAVPLGTYNWKDEIVPYLTLITSAGSSPPVAGISSATGSVVGTNPTGTPTFTVQSGSYILPGEGPTAAHSATNLSGFVVSETTDATATTSATKITINMTGTVAEMLGAATIDSVTFASGSNLVESATNFYTMSANLVTQAKTQNYEFDGTIAMSNFNQDYSAVRTNTNLGWNPGLVIFTGSVTGLNVNAALGKFLTGAALTVNSNRTAYDPTQALSATNFPTESGSLTGNIVSGASTNALNLTFASGTTGTTYNTITAALTYRDATGNTVTLNETGTFTANALVTVGLGSSNTGTVMYSSTTPTVSSTLVGNIAASVVTFTDNTTLSLK